MSYLLDVWIPFLPPSSNQIYTKRHGGGRQLSTAARMFKVRAMKTIQQECRVAFLNIKRNVPYELRVAVFFEKVINKGYQKSTQDRYTKIDVSNRLKLIEDVVAWALDLDDPHNFRIIMEKQCDPDNPGLYVTLTELPETEVGLTKENYDRLRLRHTERDRTRSSVSPERFLGRSSRNRPGGPNRTADRKRTS